MVRGSLECLCVNDMNLRNDIDIARQLAGSLTDAVWTASIINGTVWKFSGRPVGDIAADVKRFDFLQLKLRSGLAEKISG